MGYSSGGPGLGSKRLLTLPGLGDMARAAGRWAAGRPVRVSGRPGQTPPRGRFWEDESRSHRPLGHGGSPAELLPRAPPHCGGRGDRGSPWSPRHEVGPHCLTDRPRGRGPAGGRRELRLLSAPHCPCAVTPAWEDAVMATPGCPPDVAAPRDTGGCLFPKLPPGRDPRTQPCLETGLLQM